MGPVRFQIMSDLHLETPTTRPMYEEFKIVPQCMYLALLGDIGNVADPRFFAFLEEQLQQFKIVFFLLGNHEPYGMDLPAAKASIHAFVEEVERRRLVEVPRSSVGRFVFLDQTRYNLADNITVLGCTLYSSILPSQRGPISRFVSDFSNIQNWTIDDHCTAYNDNLHWLNSQVAQIQQDEPHCSIIVFTHHSPTLLPAANDLRHIDDAADVQSAFVSDLSDQTCWKCTQVRLWAFGHTHFNCDFEEPQTGKRVVTNQRGYHRTKLLTFSASKVVSVDIDDCIESEVSKVEGARKKRTKQKLERCCIL